MRFLPAQGSHRNQHQGFQERQGSFLIHQSVNQLITTITHEHVIQSCRLEFPPVKLLLHFKAISQRGSFLKLTELQEMSELLIITFFFYILLGKYAALVMSKLLYLGCFHTNLRLFFPCFYRGLPLPTGQAQSHYFHAPHLAPVCLPHPQRASCHPGHAPPAVPSAGHWASSGPVTRRPRVPSKCQATQQLPLCDTGHSCLPPCEGGPAGSQPWQSKHQTGQDQSATGHQRLAACGHSS